MEETNIGLYPTETIDLPSKGVFYPEGHPLKSGKIELKYMTAKEEDILTSTNLIQKGIVLDKLMDSLIVTKGVKSSDLLIGDLNAVMVATRILGYGKDYEVGITCPNCGKSVEQTVDLTTLKTQNEPEQDSAHTISVELPISKAVVVLKLLTRGDELDIEKEVKSLKKVSNDIDADSTTRLRKMIVSVNGEKNAAKIWQFVENLLVKDAKYLREQYKLKVPDVDFTVSINCSCSDDDDIQVRLPIGARFFWPDA
jgi:hypothetical protein